MISIGFIFDGVAMVFMHGLGNWPYWSDSTYMTLLFLIYVQSQRPADHGPAIVRAAEHGFLIGVPCAAATIAAILLCVLRKAPREDPPEPAIRMA